MFSSSPSQSRSDGHDCVDMVCSPACQSPICRSGCPMPASLSESGIHSSTLYRPATLVSTRSPALQLQVDRPNGADSDFEGKQVLAVRTVDCGVSHDPLAAEVDEQTAAVGGTHRPGHGNQELKDVASASSMTEALAEGACASDAFAAPMDAEANDNAASEVYEDDFEEDLGDDSPMSSPQKRPTASVARSTPHPTFNSGFTTTDHGSDVELDHSEVSARRALCVTQYYIDQFYGQTKFGCVDSINTALPPRREDGSVFVDWGDPAGLVFRGPQPLRPRRRPAVRCSGYSGCGATTASLAGERTFGSEDVDNAIFSTAHARAAAQTIPAVQTAPAASSDHEFDDEPSPVWAQCCPKAVVAADAPAAAVLHDALTISPKSKVVVNDDLVLEDYEDAFEEGDDGWEEHNDAFAVLPQLALVAKDDVELDDVVLEGRGKEDVREGPVSASALSPEVCVVWDGAMWHGTARYGTVWYGMVWYGTVWCGVVWCGVVWCGVVWCGVVWCGVVWCGVPVQIYKSLHTSAVAYRPLQTLVDHDKRRWALVGHGLL